MKHIISKLLLTSALTLGLTNPATALDFTFSFSNTIGGVDGTVTGRILGLTNNALSIPTGGVFVDSAPNVFADVGDFNFLDIFVTNSGTENNTFMVTNGQITEGRFSARGRVDSIDRLVALDLSGDPDFSNISYSQDLNSDDNFSLSAETVQTTFNGVTFTQVPVPLEISGLPAILVIGGVVAIAHFKGKGKGK